jgi:hypothetical protein
MGFQVGRVATSILALVKGIARWDFRLTELHKQTLVLVKGDRHMGSQVNPTAHRF